MLPKLSPDTIDIKKLEGELALFMDYRSWLVGRFGVADEVVAQAAISIYVAATLDPAVRQIHLGVAQPDGITPSFVISRGANDALVDAGFYRVRYASVEANDGQYKTTPITVLAAWGEGGQQAFSALFCTDTHIAGRLDSKAFIIASRNQSGAWQLWRTYLFECAPGNRAWDLGNMPLTRDVLPNADKLGVTDEVLMPLLEVQTALRDGSHPNAFMRGQSVLKTAAEFLQFLETESYSQVGYPAPFVAFVDYILTGLQLD